MRNPVVHKATDLINKHDYIYMSRFRVNTVVAIPRKDSETDKEYRDRCRLDPNCIGIAMNDALPSQFVVIELIPPYFIKNHETSRD